MHINLKQEQNEESVKKKTASNNVIFWTKIFEMKKIQFFALHVNVTNQWGKSIPERKILNIL